MSILRVRFHWNKVKVIFESSDAENAMENAKSTLGNEAKRSGYRYVMFFFNQVLLIVFFPC